MARPLLIANPENATIEELKQVSRVGSNVAIRWWFNNYVCKNEEKLLERLDQAILDVINNPKKAQKITCIGTLI
jgi:recombinational DNA repair protein RecR